MFLRLIGFLIRVALLPLTAPLLFLRRRVPHGAWLQVDIDGSVVEFATPRRPSLAMLPFFGGPRGVALSALHELADRIVGEPRVRGVLVVPVLSLRRRLFTVPFPYSCRRGESDAGDDLVIECRGDDGAAYARLRAEPGRIVIVARDYGRIELRRTEDAIALPAGTTATLFAPLKYPGGP